MGVVTLNNEYTSPLPAEKLFKLFVLDFDTLAPKVLPQVLKNVELISGDGGPGSIKKYNFAEGGAWKYLKHRVDALDKENMIYNYTAIDGEGDAKMETVDNVSYEAKVEATPDGGSKSTVVIKFHLKPGAHVKEEDVKEGVENHGEVYKALEAYALANPN